MRSVGIDQRRDRLIQLGRGSRSVVAVGRDPADQARRHGVDALQRRIGEHGLDRLERLLRALHDGIAVRLKVGRRLCAAAGADREHHIGRERAVRRSLIRGDGGKVRKRAGAVAAIEQHGGVLIGAVLRL